MIRRILATPLMLFMLVICTKALEAAPPKVKANPETQTADQAMTLAQKTGLRIFYKDFPAALISGAIGDPAEAKDYPQLLRALTALDEELAKYPTGFIQKLNWKHVVFLKKFFLTEHPLAGLYDPDQDIIYLEFLRHRYNDLFFRHGVHHEIFHVIHLQARMQFITQDTEWAALNPEDFMYGKSDDLGKDNNRVYRLSPKIKGFPTPYALSSIQEDMAEIFACLMIPSQHRLLKKWEEDDPALRQKVVYIKNLAEQFDPSLNAAYWENLIAKP